MKTCVIFAASIFDEAKLFVLQEYLEMFKTHFSDAFFYIGINYGSIPTLEEEIAKYNLHCKMLRLENESIYTKTDASATQTALKMLKEDNQSYDIYWFAHTKGAVNQGSAGYDRNQVRNMYFGEMFNRRVEIEKMFVDNPDLGTWGVRGNSISAAGVQWRDYNVDSFFPICTNVKIPPFNYTHVNWSYIETMYVIKKEAVEAYIKALPEHFFTTKLDPWYMETVVPWIASRCGYFPYVKVKRDYFNHCELTDVTKQWIDENELPHLTPLLSL